MIKDEKGYILLSSILIFSMIFILIFVSLNICISSYSMNKSYVDSKKVFYMAESGIDIAYYKTIYHVKNAIIFSKQKVDEYLNSNKDKEIDESILNQKFENAFRLYFSRYVFEDDINNSGKDKIKINITNGVNTYNKEINFEIESSYKEFNIERSICTSFYISIPNRLDEFEDYHIYNTTISTSNAFKNINDLVKIKNWYRKR